MVKYPDYAQLTQAMHAMFNNPDARSATKYISPTERVTVTRLFRTNRRNTRESLLVTYGAMNWAGRLFVKACQKAGEPFPVKKVQLRFWPKRKNKKRVK